MQSSSKQTIATLRKRLLSRSWATLLDEQALHQAVWEVLKAADLKYKHEVVCTGGRIDFKVGKLGIEIKVEGSNNEVLRQLARYAEGGDFEELLLITTRFKHRMPPDICGVPLSVVKLFRL